MYDNAISKKGSRQSAIKPITKGIMVIIINALFIESGVFACASLLNKATIERIIKSNTRGMPPIKVHVLL